MATIRITGAKEMEALLRKLPQAISKAVLTKSLRSAAIPILDEARIHAPVGQQGKGRVRLRKTRGGKVTFSNYGKLKLSLKIITVPARLTVHSATVAVTVGKAYWGMFQEFGTRFRKKPTVPFMRQAFEMKKNEALSKLGKELGDGIEKAAEKLVRKT